MTLYIIVPVKSLSEAKTRLASVLDAAERQTLALRLLKVVLAVVVEAQRQLSAQGAVISADPEVLELAAGYGLTPLEERSSPPTPTRPSSENRASQVVEGKSHEDPNPKSHIAHRTSQISEPESPSSSPHPPSPLSTPPEASLNAALTQATAWAADQGASAVLILPADLPLVTATDVAALWQASQHLYSALAMVIAPDRWDQGTNALLVRPPGALHYQFGTNSFQRHCEQARQLGMAWHVQRSPGLDLDVDIPDDLESYLVLEAADAGEMMMDRHAETPYLDAQIEAFLQQPGLLMRLGTVGRDGFPQVTPVWYLYADGLFYITTAGDRVKTRNMLADPRVGFAIDSDVKPYQGLSVWGRARLAAEGEEARSMTRRIAARYVSADRLDAMEKTLMQSPRVVFTIEPVRLARMGSWGDA